MAIDSILSSLEAGIAEGRKDALARQQLEQQQIQAAQAQANSDRSFQLGVLNSMIGLQQSMPKPPDARKLAAQTWLDSQDQDELMGALTGQWNDPVLVARAERAGAILGDEGAWIHRAVGLQDNTPQGRLTREFNTEVRSGKYTPEAMDELGSAVASGTVSAWATKHNVPGPRADLLAATFTGANGVLLENLRDMSYDELIKSPGMTKLIEEMDSIIGASGDRSKIEPTGDLHMALAQGISELERNPIISNTTRGRELTAKYRTALSGLNANAFQVPENETPTSSEVSEKVKRGLQAVLAGKMDSEFLQSANDFYGADAVTAAQQYNAGVLSPEDAAKYGPMIVKIHMDSGMLDPGDSSVLSRSLSMGNRNGPKTVAMENAANRALGDAKKKLSEARAGGKAETDPQPLEVAVVSNSFQANRFDIRTYEENLVDLATDISDKLSDGGKAALISAADDTMDPTRVKIAAEVAYMADRGEDYDDVLLAVAKKYGKPGGNGVYRLDPAQYAIKEIYDARKARGAK